MNRASFDQEIAEPLPDGYRLTELGPLPEEWQVMGLGEVAHISAGGSAPQGSAYFGGQHPFVRVQHLDEEGYEVRRCDFITDEAVRKYRLRLFPPGTIVFPKSGASIRLEKRGVLSRPSYLVSHLCAVIPNRETVDGDFLFYTLKSIRLAAEKADGYPTLTLGEIQEKNIPLPPLPEQRAIAHVLRTVQRAKEAGERVVAALKELKKSLMRHLFTYGPVTDVKATGRSPQRDTELGPIPAHWEVVRLGEVVEIHDSKRVPLNEKQRRAMQGRYPYCGANGILDYVNDFLFDGEYVLLAEDGGYWGTYQNSAYIMQGRFWVNNHAHIIQALPDKSNNTFLMYLLNFLDLAQYISGTTRGKLNQGVMKNIPIPLPPLSEQREIARILQAVDRRIAAEEAYVRALETLFKTLLHELMTARRRLPAEFVVGATRRVAPTEDAPTRLVPTGDAPTRVAPTEVAPTRVAPTRVVPTEVAPTRVAPTGEQTP